MRKHAQLVPLDLPAGRHGPPWGEKATVGGVLAANASGPSRHAYGSPRDFTIGLRVVTADGRVTRTGGRVVKNVAGYDLCKLYIGSLGTLGIIVEATFKLAPQPRAERTVFATFDTPARACAFAAELQRRGLAIRAVQLLNPTATSARREIGELAQGAAADLGEPKDATNVWESVGRLSSTADTVLSCKATALPTRIPSLIESLEAVGGPPRILGLPTIGVLYASWTDLDDAEETVRRLRAAASAAGGSLVIERCPPDLKRRLDVFGDVPVPSFHLMRRIKQQFDPKGILSPGRHLGRL
jgi:glycolate oxidase FAD binding subunit